MRIAIDLRPLQIGHQNRGVGAYLLNLLQNIPDESDVKYIFLRYDSSNPIEDYGIGEGRDYVDVTVKKHSFSKRPSQILVYVWTSLMPAFGKVSRHRPQVFIQPDYLLGAPRILGCKVVTIAYDLIPFRLQPIYLPRWTKFFGYRHVRFKSRARMMLHAWFYERKYKNGLRLLRRSARIISISKSTTQDLQQIAKVPARKISTIYPAASFRQESADQVISKKVRNLVDSMSMPYVVFVGGTDRRRQVEELVYAYNLYNAHQGPLGLLLGGNEFRLKSKSLSRQAREAITTSSYQDNLHMLGRITEAEKHYIMEHAAAFVYPTLYEGFGLPVLEAMACGCPVVTYKNSSIPEIAGQAALYVDKPGGYQIYQKLVELLSKPELAAKLRKRGQARAKSFDWNKSANAVWAEIIKLV